MLTCKLQEGIKQERRRGTIQKGEISFHDLVCLGLRLSDGKGKGHLRRTEVWVEKTMRFSASPMRRKRWRENSGWKGGEGTHQTVNGKKWKEEEWRKGKREKKLENNEEKMDRRKDWVSQQKSSRKHRFLDLIYSSLFWTLLSTTYVMWLRQTANISTEMEKLFHGKSKILEHSLNDWVYFRPLLGWEISTLNYCGVMNLTDSVRRRGTVENEVCLAWRLARRHEWRRFNNYSSTKDKRDTGQRHQRTLSPFSSNVWILVM